MHNKENIHQLDAVSITVNAVILGSMLFLLWYVCDTNSKYKGKRIQFDERDVIDKFNRFKNSYNDIKPLRGRVRYSDFLTDEQKLDLFRSSLVNYQKNNFIFQTNPNFIYSDVFLSILENVSLGTITPLGLTIFGLTSCCYFCHYIIKEYAYSIKWGLKKNVKIKNSRRDLNLKQLDEFIEANTILESFIKTKTNDIELANILVKLDEDRIALLLWVTSIKGKKKIVIDSSFFNIVEKIENRKLFHPVYSTQDVLIRASYKTLNMYKNTSEPDKMVSKKNPFLKYPTEKIVIENLIIEDVDTEELIKKIRMIDKTIVEENKNDRSIKFGYKFNKNSCVPEEDINFDYYDEDEEL